MSNRYDLVCVSHRPMLRWDSERGSAFLEDLRLVYRHREAIFALPDELWPDDHRRALYFLQQHRNCTVRALHEDKSDPTLSEPLDFVEPPEPAGTVTLHGAGGAALGPLGLTDAEEWNLAGRHFPLPGSLAGVAASEREDGGVRRAVAYLGDEELLRVLDLADQGYTVRGVFADPMREAVAVVLSADHLPIVEPFAEAPALSLVFNPEARYLDGQWWYRGRIKVQPQR